MIECCENDGSSGSGHAISGFDTDSIYLDHRYYDPSTDQFLSVDPLVAITGQAYAFAGNDPLNAADPLGLAWWCMQGTSHNYTGDGEFQ